MSGFAAVIHLDGAPVDPAWLETMADFLAFRGPDARQVWISGNVGMCHTLLRVSKETDGRPQIASLDGSVWIAGDIRVDDRDTLIAKLPGHPSTLRKACSAELILHAYAAWGESCLDHLLGDFSFVIWDARRRQVFAGRDHLGVRLLYYALIGRCLLISNTLDCIRQIQIVPNKLNERAIGDFLLAGQNWNPSTTFFQAIDRLPAAHCLTAEENGLRTKRFWTLPIDEPLYYRRAADYVDRFHELLKASVQDRLPDGPLGVFMSGGLDSPLLAATAVQLGAPTIAFTQVWDRLIPDEERRYARLAADHLRIPIRYRVSDDEPWGWEPNCVPAHTPEPWSNPLSIAPDHDHYRDVSAHARVVFVGLGPDAALLYEWKPHLNYLVKQRRWGRLFLDLIADFTAYPRVPFLPGLLRRWNRRNSTERPATPFPAWLCPDFESRNQLRERWREIHSNPVPRHPLRPTGYSYFACDFPMGGVEDFDAGQTGTATEFCQPFLDVRLLRFLLSVPAVPWCRDKHLIRTALRGLLPEAIRLRPKTPLTGHPFRERLDHAVYRAPSAAPALGNYVDRSHLPAQPGPNPADIEASLRILGLEVWLLNAMLD